MVGWLDGWCFALFQETLSLLTFVLVLFSKKEEERVCIKAIDWQIERIGNGYSSSHTYSTHTHRVPVGRLIIIWHQSRQWRDGGFERDLLICLFISTGFSLFLFELNMTFYFNCKKSQIVSRFYLFIFEMCHPRARVNQIINQDETLEDNNVQLMKGFQRLRLSICQWSVRRVKRSKKSTSFSD